MTARAQLIDKYVLAFLESRDGASMIETIIHAAVAEKFSQLNEPRPSVEEMDASFARLNSSKWILGVHSVVKHVMKWTITDDGRAALLQM